jgi:hypothetical protein
MSGVYFDSIQSFNAKGLLQLRVPAVFFFGGVRRRRGGRPGRLHEESEGFDVIFFSRVLCALWQVQTYPYPTSVYLYSYDGLYVFLI